METSSSHPPTPPHDTEKEIENALEFLNPSFPDSPSDLRVNDSLSTVVTQTPPPSSPTPIDTCLNKPNEPPLKKIRFSPYTHEITGSSEHADESSAGEGRSPAEGHRTQPGATKSILKRTTRTAASLNASSDEHTSLPAVLDSAFRQLQTDSRASRLDAYLVLSGTLRVSQGRFSPSLLVDKVAFFEHCLRRDLTIRNEESGALDINLVTQALKLTALLFRIPQLFFSFSRDFLAESMAQTVESLTRTGVSKALVTSRLMFLVHTPLVSRVGSSEQLNSLISALADLHRRVSGNNILILRLLMYRMLLYEASDLMLDRINSWLPLLVKGMLSASSETRNRAIECATYAGKTIGSKPSATKALQHLLARDLKGQTLFSILEQHLCDLLNGRTNAIQVPKIWSSLVLFFRSKQSSLSNWCSITPWMKIIQRCFNSSDKGVSIQAYDSWKKLIYSVGLDESTRPSMIKALRQPISSRLCLRAKDKDSKLLWEAAFSSYCTLLRHSFPSQASPEQIQMFWDNFVAQVLTNTALYHEDHAEKACLVLMALFGDNEPLLQYLGARAESDYTSDLDAIACISPRWIRKHLRSVLQVVEVVVSRVSWNDDGSVGDALLGVWSSLMKTISEAGAKEVKASRDLTDAVAAILVFLGALWSKGPPHPLPCKDQTGFRETCSLLVRCALDHLGPINFAGQSRSADGDSKFALDADSSDESHHDTHQSALHIIVSLFSQDRWNGPWNVDQPSETANLLRLCLDGFASYNDDSVALSPASFLKEVFEEPAAGPLLHSRIWERLASITNGSSNKRFGEHENYDLATGDSTARSPENLPHAQFQGSEQQSEANPSFETANESGNLHNDHPERLVLQPSRYTEGGDLSVYAGPTNTSIDSSIALAGDPSFAAQCLTADENRSSFPKPDGHADVGYDAFVVTELSDSNAEESQAANAYNICDHASEAIASARTEEITSSDNTLDVILTLLPDSKLNSHVGQRSESNSMYRADLSSPCIDMKPSEGFENVPSDHVDIDVQPHEAVDLRSLGCANITGHDSPQLLDEYWGSMPESSSLPEMEYSGNPSTDGLGQDHELASSSPPGEEQVEELDNDTIRVAMVPACTPIHTGRNMHIDPEHAEGGVRSSTMTSRTDAAQSIVKAEEPEKRRIRPMKRALDTLISCQPTKRRRSTRHSATESIETESDARSVSDRQRDIVDLCQDVNHDAENVRVGHSQRRRSARLSGVRESPVDNIERRQQSSEPASTLTAASGAVSDSISEPEDSLHYTPSSIEAPFEHDRPSHNIVCVTTETPVTRGRGNLVEESTPSITGPECLAAAAREVTSSPVEVTAETILQQLRIILTTCKATVFGPQDAQQVDEIQLIAMDIQKEVLEGKRRNGRQSTVVAT